MKFRDWVCAFSLLASVMAFGGAADHVDPFIGTSFTGHTHPAACLPFGLVQAGPDTGNLGWHYCSGYRFEDNVIIGFSQTHLNGTGGMDLGDAMIMPVGETNSPYFPGSRFSKSTERASPGWYEVMLDDAGAHVGVTATRHVGCYEIRFSGSGRKKLLVDTQYGIVKNGDALSEHVLWADVGLLGSDAVGGTLRVRQWVTREYSFKTVFSRPIVNAERLQRRDEREWAPRYLLSFDLKESEPLLVKVALSAEGGLSGVERNLVSEVPDWDFDAIRRAAKAEWERVLSRVEVSGTEDEKRNIYTALYHLFQQPNNIADAGASPFYSTLSLWDTFRAAHPLYTILCPERVPDMVDSILEQGRRNGFLPVWPLWGIDVECMIGTHSIPVVVDACMKGLWPKSGKDGDLAIGRCFDQIKETLTQRHGKRWKEEWGVLEKYGYYPCDVIRGESVSRLLEGSYDDWCAARLAAKLGREEEADFFRRRAQCWTNVFDSSLGLVRGRRSDGSWRTPYDPLALGHGAETENDFTEGNAWQYTWHVLQDPEGLVRAMGGVESAVARLDSMFMQETKLVGGGKRHDITGVIGQYVHGNEPSHHVPYFYQYLRRPDRVAEVVRDVFDRLYLPKPDGLCGNDDCGQMSAWYVFSAMGFYPFNPCSGEYVIGAPQVRKVTLHFENGKTFAVVAKCLSKENKYVKTVTLNGVPVAGWKIRHADVMAGGELVFEMTDRRIR